MALRCNEAFAYWLQDGTPRVLTAGQLVKENDPAVVRFPDKFSDADDYLVAERYREVEAATAAPGEKRGARRPAPRKSKAAEKTDEGVDVLADPGAA